MKTRAVRLAIAHCASYGWNVMLDWSQCSAVERSAGKVSGSWLFAGTRVPVSTLFQNLESGASIDEFLDWFPGVSRDQVSTVLEFAERAMIRSRHDPQARIFLDRTLF